MPSRICGPFHNKKPLGCLPLTGADVLGVGDSALFSFREGYAMLCCFGMICYDMI